MKREQSQMMMAMFGSNTGIQISQCSVGMALQVGGAALRNMMECRIFYLYLDSRCSDLVRLGIGIKQTNDQHKRVRGSASA
jgi:hypothetical protein